MSGTMINSDIEKAFSEMESDAVAMNNACRKTLSDECDICRLVSLLDEIGAKTTVHWPNSEPGWASDGWIDFTCGEQCMTMYFEPDGSLSREDE